MFSRDVNHSRECNEWHSPPPARGVIKIHDTDVISTSPPPPMPRQPLVDQGVLIVKVSRLHSFRHTTLSRIFWTIGQPDVEISTSQHIIQETDIHAAGGIRTRNPSKRTAADPRVRPHGHWDRHNLNTELSINALCKPPT
jgi:hypothetical protein